MSKIYTYFLLLLLFISPGRMVFSQCPPEPLLVEFDAYEIKQGVQDCGFTNESVISRLKVILGEWLNIPSSDVSVLVVNDPPSCGSAGKFYTYCNSVSGRSNTFTYSGGGQSGTCPVTIKVLDKYHPNCGKNNSYNPNFPSTLVIDRCSPTKEQLDEFFIGEAQQIIAGSKSWGEANWNDLMYHCGKTNNGNNCDGSGLKEAYIDWENTDISNFRLDGKGEDWLQVQYVLLDKAGNRGLRYNNDVAMPCRTKIKVKRTNFDVDFVCPDQSVLSDTEVILDLPKEPEGEYITWNTGWKSLKDSNNKDLNNSSYAWTPAGDGISVTSFPKEGVYKLTLEAKVCNWNNQKRKKECPVNVVKKVDSCDPK